MTILGFQLIQEIKVHITTMSQVVRKPAFGICKNKGADQFGGNSEADQCLCFSPHR